MSAIINLRRFRAQAAAHTILSGAEVDPLELRLHEANGIDLDNVTELAGPICRIYATFYEDGSFEVDDLGEAAFAIVVLDEDAESELDVCAWSVRAPDIFGTLLQQAALIGAYNVLNPATYYSGKPCRLWRTPLRWLQQGCQGAVVLDPVQASVTLAKAPGALAAQDLEHGKELIQAAAIARDKLVVPVADRRAA